MEYKMTKNSRLEIRLEKYTEPKGFFRNTTGPLKIGEIELFNSTNEGWFEDFLIEEDGVYYMELGSVKGFDFPYRGEASRISIGDKRNNIPVEERIKFLYEALSSNVNYNCLEILYKGSDYMLYNRVLFEMAFNKVKYEGVNYEFSTFFNIKDL